MRKQVLMVKFALFLYTVLLLVHLSGATFGQELREKKYRIFCGGLDIMSAQAESPGLQQLYRPSSSGAGEMESQVFDLSNGFIVPVSIKNYGIGELSIREGSAYWTDFLEDPAIEVKYVLNEDEEIFEEPASAYTVELCTRFREEKDVLPADSTDTDKDYDEVWFIIEFASPELLKEGKYVFKPSVDFDALAVAIPDLSSENLAELPSFKQVPGAHFDNWVKHKKLVLGSVEKEKGAVSEYVLVAVTRFEFGKEQEARQLLNEAFAINASSVPAKITLAGIDFETDRVQEALTGLLEAWALIEGNGDPYYLSDCEKPVLDLQHLDGWIGYCYHRLADFVNAENYYQLAIDRLNEEAFSPGPDIDSGWSAIRSKLQYLLQAARKQTPWEDR